MSKLTLLLGIFALVLGLGASANAAPGFQTPIGQSQTIVRLASCKRKLCENCRRTLGPGSVQCQTKCAGC